MLPCRRASHAYTHSFTIPAFLRAMLSRLLRLALNAASDSGMVGVSPKNDFSASVVHFTRV